jgi:TatD DNase family protein
MIDTHAHVSAPPLLEHVDELLARAEKAGVEKIVNICTDQTSLEQGLELSKRYPWVFNTAATTPHDVAQEGDAFFPLVEKNVDHLVGIGETGLDYFYEHSPKELQQKFLIRYLDLAKKRQLPLVFHCRNAFEDLFSICDEVYPNCPGLLHCFTGNLQEAKKGMDRGWMISMSGIITFKKSQELREVIKYIPLKHIVVETDAPYLAPQTKRGMTNEPAFVAETLAYVAELKSVSVSEMEKITTENALKFFPFSKGKILV